MPPAAEVSSGVLEARNLVRKRSCPPRRLVLRNTRGVRAQHRMATFRRANIRGAESTRRTQRTCSANSSRVHDLRRLLDRSRVPGRGDVPHSGQRRPTPVGTARGSASGIDGQVTWNRTRKDVESLDEERLESSHPVEFNEFVTLTTRTRLKTRRRARKSINE